MRLLELELSCFGAVANRRLDLSPGERALHLIYGPNEAGKSTALRAILGLLFGIDHQSPDAKVFGGDALRIRARLRDAEGRVLALTRRKGMKNTLLDEGDQPLDEAVLQRVLSGMPAAVFRSTFGLDNARLREGGEQLRLGKGDLGQSLFQAGAGLSGLNAVLSRLSAEAEAVWSPRGKKPLNQAIEQHAQARRAVREHGKRAETVRAQEQDLLAARQERAALQARRAELQVEHSRLDRALRALPKLAQRRDLAERRAALGLVPVLSEDCEERRRNAQQERSACGAELEQLERTIAKLEGLLGELVVPEALLALSSDQVTSIRNRLGSHLKAQEDLPNRRAELRVLELEAAAALRALGDPVTLAEVESLRIDVATQARIAKLANEHSGLCERARAAERDLAAAEAQRQRARAELAALPRLPAAGAAVLPEELSLPSEATLEAFAGREAELDQARARLEAADQALLEREERVQVQLDRIAREGAPPTEAELQQARAARDALLPQIRAALAGEISALPRLIQQFEALQLRADDIADRLRREASRVAELAQLEAEREANGRARARLLARREELARAAQALDGDWQGVWEPLGVVPRAPREMRPLLARLGGLLEQGERGRAEALRRKREAEAELEAWRGSWTALMRRLSLREDASAEEAQAVLEELRRLFEKVDAIAQLRTRIEAMERDAAQFEREVGELVARRAPDLCAAPLAQAAEQLSKRHEQAQRDLVQRTRIAQDLADAQARAAELRARVADADRALAELMRAARAESVEQLVELEQRFRRARELDAQLASVERDLLDQCDGRSADELSALVDELGGPDRIRSRLYEIQEELEAAEVRRSELDHSIGRLEAGLESLRRDDLAAQDAAEAEQHLARVKTLAHAYVQRRLAIELMRRAIRRYRDAHQGPIVGRASELFARLTLGRYPRLMVDYDARDEPALHCQNEQGRAVPVEALSDGARDQLYLALRLSSLEHFAARSDPMPLVLDDVLIHFDDDRARAALEVLGEFSSVTQVLFFTHHMRLVELARKAIPKERLIEHHLEPEHTPRQAIQGELF